MNRCVILASAPGTDPHWLRSQLRETDTVICADGGYLLAQQTGIVPDLVVGDFDSCHLVIPEEIPRVTLSPCKDDTDMMAVLRLALKEGYRDFLLAGALGGRIDHTMANFCALYFLYTQGAKGILADQAYTVFLAPPGNHMISAQRGKTLSLFPFVGAECVVSYQGMQYPLDHFHLEYNNPRGISNVVLEDNAAIIVHSGIAIVMLLNQDLL